jgi:hypothetical protein
VQLVAAVALTVVLRAGPDAPAPVPPSAEAEVEALLAATAQKSPPAEVLVVLDGPDPKTYSLEDATLELDGKPMSFSGRRQKPVQVSDGDHVVSARLVYRGQNIGPLPWQQGPKWTLPARVQLQATRGLRLTVRLTVEADDSGALLSQRLGIRSAVEPEMLAVVDDAPLPPPPLPQLPPPAELAPVAASQPTPRTLASADIPPAAPAKKRKKRVARTTRPSAVVPHSAGAPAAAAVVPVAAPAPQPAPETQDGLEQVTARLRSALAAPRDGGVPQANKPPQ